MTSHWQPKKIIENIQISFVYPPIPDRNFDWQATRKGYDEGDPVGQGRTPLVALADLLEREMERDDSQDDPLSPENIIKDSESDDSPYCSCGAIHDGLEEFQRCKACGGII